MLVENISSYLTVFNKAENTQYLGLIGEMPPAS